MPPALLAITFDRVVEMLANPIFGGAVALFSIVLALVAAWLGYVSYRLSQRVAQAQGVFAKKQVQIRLYGDLSVRCVVLAAAVIPRLIAVVGRSVLRLRRRDKVFV